MQKPDACRLPGDQASNLKKMPQFTMCRNLPSTATYRAATYLVPQLTVLEISVTQFAYCRNLPPAATYRLPEFSVPQHAVAATFRSPKTEPMGTNYYAIICIS